MRPMQLVGQKKSDKSDEVKDEPAFAAQQFVLTPRTEQQIQEVNREYAQLISGGGRVGASPMLVVPQASYPNANASGPAAPGRRTSGASGRQAVSKANAAALPAQEPLP